MTASKPRNKFLDLFSSNKNKLKAIDRSLVGSKAESLTEKFLEKNGLKTLQRNFSCKVGEIDRIMLDDETLVFVEVRLRHHQQVSAAETVNIHKQRKIIKTAKYFLLKNHQYQNYPCRFDVIALDGLHENKIDWIKDAFQLQE